MGERKFFTFQPWTVTNQVSAFFSKSLFNFLVVHVKMVSWRKSWCRNGEKGNWRKSWSHLLHSRPGQSQIDSQSIFPIFNSWWCRHGKLKKRLIERPCTPQQRIFWKKHIGWLDSYVYMDSWKFYSNFFLKMFSL